MERDGRSEKRKKIRSERGGRRISGFRTNQ